MFNTFVLSICSSIFLLTIKTVNVFPNICSGNRFHLSAELLSICCGTSVCQEVFYGIFLGCTFGAEHNIHLNKSLQCFFLEKAVFRTRQKPPSEDSKHCFLLPPLCCKLSSKPLPLPWRFKIHACLLKNAFRILLGTGHGFLKWETWKKRNTTCSCRILPINLSPRKNTRQGPVACL